MDNWLADKNLRRRTLTELSRQIAERINGAVHLNPVSVVATALLATGSTLPMPLSWLTSSNGCCGLRRRHARRQRRLLPR